MDIKKSSGLILHPTALPSKYGIGDIGNAAFEFVNFLEATETKIWQLLPLGLTSNEEFSPYSSPSSLLGNRYLIDLDNISDYQPTSSVKEFDKKSVDFKNVYKFKDQIFYEISQNINIEDPIFFELLNDELIRSHITYLVLRDKYGLKTWTSWEKDHQEYRDNLFENIAKNDKKLLKFHIFTQFEFFRQWGKLREYANKKQIQILGDIPIYVNHNSADVWLNKEIFELDSDGEMSFVSGAVPDSFNKEGQVWNNCLYQWDRQKLDNYKYWTDKLNKTLDLYNYLRIDHFVGFFKYWVIKKGDSALKGEWKQGPKSEFFDKISKNVDLDKLLAEDLGVILKETKSLLNKYNIPGMKVLQQRIPDDNEGLPFQGDTDIVNQNKLFEEASDDYFEEIRPKYWEENLAAYTGTHDSPTIKQWLNEVDDIQIEFFNKYKESSSSLYESDVWNFISLVWESPCQLAVTTIQDLLELGKEARFNIPGTKEKNWVWRLEDLDILKNIKKDLKKLNKYTDRA